MSCCGEPKDKPGASNSKPQAIPNGHVTTQPGLHPGLEKPQFYQQPSLSPPPAAHTNPFGANNFQVAQQQTGQTAWGNSPSPPPMNDFGSMNTATTQTYNGSTYNGSTFNVQNGFSSVNQPLMHLSAAHTPQMSLSSSPMGNQTTNMGQLSTQIQDEGKMSISIDFGAY